MEAHRIVTRRNLPHFLGSRLTDGGEVVSLKRQPLFAASEVPGTHLLEDEQSSGP
jgi:hypothetical protein